MGTTIRLTVSAFAEHRKKLAGDFLPTVKRGMVSGAMRCLPVLHDATRKAKIVDTGRYLISWKSEATALGARVFNAAPYSAVIELGRRAGATMPPPQVIAKWLQRARGLSRKEAEAAAFVVARAIGKRGIPGKFVLKNVLPFLVKIVGLEIKHELDVRLAQP